MRKLSFIILLLSISHTAAMAQNAETFLLPPGAIWCANKNDVESVLLKKTDEARDKAAIQLARDGRCGVSQMFDQVVNVRPMSKGPITYHCFHMQDPDSAPTRLTKENEKCTPNVPVTLSKALAERTGKYRVIAQLEDRVMVECEDGGKVRLIKSGAKWLRYSSLPFSIPVKRDQTREIEGQQASLLQKGCLGDDYR
jgi:hypothetical protein